MSWKRTRRIGAVGALWLSLSLTLGMAGCAAPPVQTVTEEMPFDKAASKVVDDLFARIPKLTGLTMAAGAKVGPKLLVLNPAFDIRAGQQTSLTTAFDGHIARRVDANQSIYTVKPLTPENLAQASYFIAAGADGLGEGQNRKVWTLSLALIDAKSGAVVSRAAVRARVDSGDQLPTAFYRDSPVLIRDDVQATHLELFGPQSPDKVSPAFLSGVTALAQLQAPITAYNSQQYGQSLRQFKSIAARPGGDTLRSQVGIYVAAAQVGAQADVDASTSRIVDEALAKNALDLKLVYFKPGSTEAYTRKPFNNLSFLQAAGRGLAKRQLCATVVGHTSRTGSEDYNQKLSLRRAESIRQRLLDQTPELNGRLQTEGKGFAENLIGLGRDDESDMADRRVEIKVQPCG